MQNLKQLIHVLIILSILGNTGRTLASEETTTFSADVALSLCDRALKDTVLAGETCNLKVKLRDDYNNVLLKQRNDAIKRAEAAGAPSLPFYVWLVVGIASGVVLTRGIR